jgi:hypothetical protein
MSARLDVALVIWIINKMGGALASMNLLSSHIFSSKSLLFNYKSTELI